ncbi:long-chain-fatty-acid--CoA ligase [Paracandidimonas soli]|uniref:long-chain-fatty-acid--CoA ligase n=1 Tax=Paracandidimonas soli TaxID=1917182 RepID=UPI003340EB18
MMDFPLTLNWLRHRVQREFGATEVVTRRPDGRVLTHTYRDIALRGTLLAQRLIQAGLRPGERVATLMWNHHAHLEAYLGVPAAGGVLHTLNHRLSQDDLVYIMNHAGDRMLLIDDTLLSLYEALKDRLPMLEQVVVFNFSGAGCPEGYADHDSWISQTDAALALPEIAENDAASLCYTGGSTGRPKGVLYSHRALVMHAFCQAMVDGYGVGRADTVLGVVPMFHGNGWGLPFSAILTGARLVLPGPRVDADSLLELIEAYGVTLSAGVPTVWLKLVNALEKKSPSWRPARRLRIVTGGAAPPESLFARLARFGIDLRQGWGMTETASVITLSAPDDPGASESALADEDRNWRYRQGKPMPIVDVRIATDGRELPADGVSAGEVQVRGVCVTDSYYAQHLPERWTDDGWLRTGDIGTRDAHGNLQILERTEDMIKSGGEWIIPQELENAILDYPGIQECTVIAVPHDKWGERPVALVVEARGAALDTAALLRHLAGRFAKWQLPDAVLALPEIPRTAVGKVARRELRRTYAHLLGATH